VANGVANGVAKCANRVAKYTNRVAKYVYLGYKIDIFERLQNIYLSLLTFEF